MKCNLLSVQDVAAILGCKGDKARKIIQQLPHLNLSGNPCKQHLRIREEVLQAWIVEQEGCTPTAAKRRIKLPKYQPDAGFIPRRK